MSHPAIAAFITRNSEKSFPVTIFIPFCVRINDRKSHSQFLNGELCRKWEKTRGHLLLPLRIRTGLKIRGWEHVSKPFAAVLMQISAYSSPAFEVKSVVSSDQIEKMRNALYSRYMVVVVKSARILRLSSKWREVASSRKRRISAKAGPGRLRESAECNSLRRKRER